MNWTLKKLLLDFLNYITSKMLYLKFKYYLIKVLIINNLYFYIMIQDKLNKCLIILFYDSILFYEYS